MRQEGNKADKEGVVEQVTTCYLGFIPTRISKSRMAHAPSDPHLRSKEIGIVVPQAPLGFGWGLPWAEVTPQGLRVGWEKPRESQRLVGGHQH